MSKNTDTLINQVLAGTIRSKFDIANILFEYVILKTKMEDLSDKSWYSPKGAESNSTKLNELKTQFEEERLRFNNNTIHDFIQRRNEKTILIEKIEESDNLNDKNNNEIKTLTKEIDKLNRLIELKGRVSKLHEVGRYLEEPRMLLELC